MSIPRPEYPRPILVRNDWLNLNGHWQFRRDDADEGLLSQWYGTSLPEPVERILVPFAAGSKASGVPAIEQASIVWYQREFTVPIGWTGRVRLNIGAADYETRIFVNGQEVGQHRGGYSPISVDIQHALEDGPNTITIRVQDSLSWSQPRGKQAGTFRWPIDYDGVTGIWQTVWLEPVGEIFIENLFPDYCVNSRQLTYTIVLSELFDGELGIELSLDGEIVSSHLVDTNGRSEIRTVLEVDAPQLWSPDSPTLYDVKLWLKKSNGGELDSICSYVGLREIDVSDGLLRLNGESLYLRGVLDQGYFPGGWYTAETDDDYCRDIELTRAMGFNCARKHQKAEDPRYLYWADKMGLLIWAEMPSARIFSSTLVQSLVAEWTQLIMRDRAHPSVITWVPFNESWGVWQQASRPEQRAFVDSVVALTRSIDTTRLVVGNDGWEYSSGDLWTLHLYNDGDDLAKGLHNLIENPGAQVSGDGAPGIKVGALPGSDVSGLPVLLTECGGVGFGHYDEHDFSYGDIPKDEAALEEAVRRTMVAVNAADILQGFVWTQLTDVQQEVNGLLCFDRSPKLPLETYRAVFSGEDQ